MMSEGRPAAEIEGSLIAALEFYREVSDAFRVGEACYYLALVESLAGSSRFETACTAWRRALREDLIERASVREIRWTADSGWSPAIPVMVEA